MQEGKGCVEESCPQALAEMFNSQCPSILLAACDRVRVKCDRVRVKAVGTERSSVA